MNEIQKKIKKLSKDKKAKWIKDAEFRVRNRKWLTYSSQIARRVLAALDENTGLNQKKLASLIQVSPQYVSKVVKGKENLSLESIAKLSEALNIELITFPKYKYSPISNPQFSTVIVGMGAVTLQMNSDNPNYTLFQKILIDSDKSTISPDSVNDLFLNNNLNFERHILDNGNYSLITQSAKNE